MSGICIQRRIVGNVSYSTFTNVLYLLKLISRLFYVFNVLKFLFERFSEREREFTFSRSLKT